MRNLNKKKKIITCSVLLFSFLSITIFTNFNFEPPLYKDDAKEDDFINFPKTSDSLPSFNGTGDKVNITLHQSYLNHSFNTIVNTSIVNGNNFTLPCPNNINFNSTLTNITIQDIFAPNKTLIIEDYSAHSVKPLNTPPIAGSFQTKGTGFLENISVNIRETGAISDTGNIRVKLFNSTWVSGESKPGGTINDFVLVGNIPTPDNPDGWYNLTNTHTLLNSSKTENNTWFIALTDQGSNIVLNWYYTNDDTGGVTDNDDESYCWIHDGSSWSVATDSVWGCEIDFHLKVDLSAFNNTPNPEHIGLKINGENINGYSNINGSGYWESTKINGNASGILKYNVSANWWDVECNITKVQINYTKTDLQATSEFTVERDVYVSWNVSIGQTIDSYDSRIANFSTINFTIPSTWDINYIKAFNGSTNEKTVNVPTSVINGYREVQVLGAGNGSNWYLTANSTNVLNSIKCFVNSIELSQANYSDILSFNSTFKEIIGNGEINLSVYSPNHQYLNHTNLNTSIPSGSEISLGSWDISNNITTYGKFIVQVSWYNSTAAGFIERNITIVADTQLSLIDPPDNSNFEDNYKFNITVYYEDTGFGVGIGGVPDDIISENSTQNLQRYANGTDGYYFIEVNTSKFDWGWHTIEINASKQYYNNQSITFSFHKQINTSIAPTKTPNLGNVLKGLNVNYTFNYMDVNNNPITGATLKDVSLPTGITSTFYKIGNGNYTIELNTTDFDVTGLPSICSFNISSVGNQTQNIDITIRVLSAQTEVQIMEFIEIIPRYSFANQTIKFYFNDTIKNEPIKGLNTSDVIVRDYDTGMLWERGDHNWTLTDYDSNGTYILDVSTYGLDAGWYTLELNVSDIPNYDPNYAYVTFYLRGNYANIGLVSITDPGGQLTPLGPSNNFSYYISSNLDLDFNLTEAEFGDIIVLGDADSYFVQYENLDNSSIYGSLSHTFEFVYDTPTFGTHQGVLNTQNLVSGDYSIDILVAKKNYENATYTFYLTVINKLEINITVNYRPYNVYAGESFNISFNAKLFDGTDWTPLTGVTVGLTPNVDGSSAPSLSNMTNTNGIVSFEITIPNNAKNISLIVNIDSTYNHKSISIEVQGFTVIPPERGLTFEDLLPYILIIGALVVVAGGSIAVYRGVVVPKKREKQRILTEVKTIFDDAINLEHILVLYKGTGTCIFFKSYGSEQIDPELIGGFLSAVSSFGKEMATQEALNEISYGDKMLLLADGEYIRVALVLGKEASLILRRHLKEFIDTFGKMYKDDLPNWRGQLNPFRNAGLIVDAVLNTSIILPHQISYDFSSVKDLKSPHARDVLKVAHSCVKETKREFFFIATLLKESSEKTNKDIAEIFMGIKELRDKKILIPIEISAIEAQPVSQQEINLINQRVTSLTYLSNEEKQNLVNFLTQLGAIEREAYLSSLTKQHEIVSAPIKTTIVDNKKSAIKGVKELSKRAKIAKGKKDYLKSIELYQDAATLASNWELSNEFFQIEETIRKTKIEDLSVKKEDTEKKAENAVKSKNYAKASAKYKYASKIASEIFKLGASDMTKEVKRLTKKANEYEKLK